jgi:hypothetical protein
MATPMLAWVMTAKIDTLSSGKDVEKPTKMKPTVVFPKPVISDTLTELFMVKSLALSRMISEARRISALPIKPTASNTVASPFLNCSRSNAKNVSLHLLISVVQNRNFGFLFLKDF